MYEPYNGWHNWDTWNANLHLTNCEISWNAIIKMTAPQIRKYWIEVFAGTDGIRTNRVNFDEIFDGLN